jgi:hypothetical protein
MWKKISAAIGGLAVIVAAGVTLLNYFVLPGCDSDTIKDTVHSIFEQTSTKLTVLDQIETVAEGDGTTSCRAHVESETEKATINYTVSWNGWTPQVKIDTVDVIAPPAPPPG